jgi:hypothetical protein
MAGGERPRAALRCWAGCLGGRRSALKRTPRPCRVIHLRTPHTHTHTRARLRTHTRPPSQTAVLLIENDINTSPFTPAVHACVPPLPWAVGAQHIEEPGRLDLRDLCICSVDPPGWGGGGWRRAGPAVPGRALFCTVLCREAVLGLRGFGFGMGLLPRLQLLPGQASPGRRGLAPGRGPGPSRAPAGWQPASCSCWPEQPPPPASARSCKDIDDALHVRQLPNGNLQVRVRPGHLGRGGAGGVRPCHPPARLPPATSYPSPATPVCTSLRSLLRACPSQAPNKRQAAARSPGPAARGPPCPPPPLRWASTSPT